MFELDEEQERLLVDIVAAFAAYNPGDELGLCYNCVFRPYGFGSYCRTAKRKTPVIECEFYESRYEEAQR